MEQAIKAIQRELERVEAISHQRASDVFRDWLALTHATLLALPAHLASTQAGAGPAQDTPEVEALWAQMRVRYRQPAFDHFSRALGLLLSQATSVPGEDLLGVLYMRYANPNARTGQFFTPWAVASMMARMEDLPVLVVTRLQAAYAASPLALLGCLPSLTAATPERLGGLEPLLRSLWRFLAPHYEPVTIADPACGSGVMLLAAASRLPGWVNRLGLVRYYATDIDPTCARMAHIHFLLHGLHGEVRCANSLAAPAEVALIPVWTSPLVAIPPAVPERKRLAAPPDPGGESERSEEPVAPVAQLIS